jgi:uncharacterized membrane protein
VSKGGRNRNRSRNRSARAQPARRETTPVIPEVRTVVAEVHEVREHYGPLPPPEVLEAYEANFPGLAERIIRMAELPTEMANSQLQHRQRLEQRVVGSDIRSRWAGIVGGLIVYSFAIAAGAWLVYQNRSVEGLASILTALGAPLGAYFISEKRRREELERKAPNRGG